MNRTALRLATVAVLTNLGREPWPTLVGKHVYDSRKDDLSDLAELDRQPRLVVRTDKDLTSLRDPRNGQPSNVFSQRQVLLQVEASVVTSVKDGAGNLFPAGPVTDAGLEALLDLLEWQVWAALTGLSPVALWYRDELMPGFAIEQVDSVPLYSEDGRFRLAAREISYVVRLPADCRPRALRADDVAVDGEGNPIVAGALPPSLVTVFDRIAADGDGDLKVMAADLRAVLEARDLPTPSVHPMLDRVTMRIPEDQAPEGEEPLALLEAELLG